MTELLVWTDVETTGLDHNNDYLLEVASVVTNLDATEEYGEFHRVVYYDYDEAAWLRDNANEFVREMHDKTGLWDRLPVGQVKEFVDLDFLDFIRKFAPEPRQARLAGNSVRLDLDFIEVNLPSTYRHLHYRSVDVSALAYTMVDCWGIVPSHMEKRKTHSAIDDIRESIEEFKYLKTFV